MPIVTVRARRHPVHRADGGAGNDQLQTEFAEIFHCHRIMRSKSDVVTDLHHFLALIAASGRRKSLCGSLLCRYLPSGVPSPPAAHS